MTEHEHRRVIFGTDWWTDCDDVAALRMVCRYAASGTWQPLGVVLNAAAPLAAASVLAMLEQEGLSDLPIGIDISADDFGGNPPFQKPMAEKAGKSDIRNDMFDDAVSLYRRLLAEAPDHSVELLEVGYLPSLAALLSSPPDAISPLCGTELAAQKLRCVWCMGGNWEQGGCGKENNFCRNDRACHAAHTVLSCCPVPITFLGYEIGVRVTAHPPADEHDLVRIAFTAHGSKNGRYAWDPMLVHLAAVQDITAAGYRAVTGNASVDAQTGENRFAETPQGRHRYVVMTKEPAWYETQIDAVIQ